MARLRAGTLLHNDAGVRERCATGQPITLIDQQQFERRPPPLRSGPTTLGRRAAARDGGGGE